jgi:hypothetical protein
MDFSVFVKIVQKCCKKGLNFAKFRFANSFNFCKFVFQISYIFAKN